MGVYNEVYLQRWEDLYLPPLVTYKNQNPSKHVGAWVWLQVKAEGAMEYGADG
ncbi:MAG: hypothetical protein HQK83_06360 [Fibrobacteria bacterium]|nr:hypothetical protein [Fibrobacteria bacterium]